jgi:hypothetical protein
MLGTLFGNLSTIVITQLVTVKYGYDDTYLLLSAEAAVATALSITLKLHYDWKNHYSVLA